MHPILNSFIWLLCMLLGWPIAAYFQFVWQACHLLQLFFYLLCILCLPQKATFSILLFSIKAVLPLWHCFFVCLNLKTSHLQKWCLVIGFFISFCLGSMMHFLLFYCVNKLMYFLSYFYVGFISFHELTIFQFYFHALICL